MIEAILALFGSSMGQWLIAGLVGAGVIFAAWLKGRSSGKREGRVEQAKKEALARQRAREIEGDIARTDPTKNREELAQWQRRH